MKPSRVIQVFSHFAFFCARHGFALAVTVGAVCVVWTVVYGVLLMWAVLAGSGLGGPLAYPGGLLFFCMVTTGVCVLLFLPSTALAECVTRRFGLSLFVQIPLSVGFLALLCLMLAGGIVLFYAAATAQGVGLRLCLFFLVLLLPLGLYWWVAHAGPLVFWLLRRMYVISQLNWFMPCSAKCAGRRGICHLAKTSGAAANIGARSE